MMKLNIAIFASGAGTNAVNFIHYYKEHPVIQIAGVYCNNPVAPIISKAKTLGVEVYEFDRKIFRESLVYKLVEDQIDYVVLAGFLWLVPKNILAAYPERVINIHPSLLPKFGGKGMYGMNVHQAVVDQGETITGITIHLVNQVYDDGKALFQDDVEVNPIDSAQEIAEKVHLLEQAHYPKVVEKYIIRSTKH